MDFMTEADEVYLRASAPPVYDGLELDEQVRLTDAERGEALESIILGQAKERGITSGTFDDMLVEFSGGFRDPESKAWAFLVLNELRVGEQAINLAGEVVQLADANGGESPGVRAGVRRSPLNTRDRVRAAWAHLHHPKNAGKYTPAQLSTLKAKVKALARQHGVPIEDDEHPSEHMGYEGPKPTPGKKHTRPVQVRKRGQHSFFGEGGEADGGTGASGGEMAASAGYLKLAQAAGDGDPAAIALLANTDSKNVNPAVGPFDTGTTKNVLKHFPFELDEIEWEEAKQDTRTTDEIARLLTEATGMFGEKPYGANQTHRR